MTYGIKIAKPGKSVHSSDLRDLSVDLNTFSMFKLHSTSTTSVTINGGDSEKSATVSHSLGYVPAFLVYYKRSDESVERLIPDIPYGVDFDFYPWAYATTSGVTVGYSCKDPYNQVEATGNINNIHEDFWYEPAQSGIIVGTSEGGNGYDSAIRFSNVTLAKDQSISSAQVELNHVFSGPTNSDTRYKIYGIDEDDIGDGFASNSTKTDAYDERTQSKQGDFFNFATDVVDQVREIIARSGWTSGNHMGFTFNNNGSPTGAYIGDNYDTTIALKVVKSGSLTISFRVMIFKDKIAS